MSVWETVSVTVHPFPSGWFAGVNVDNGALDGPGGFGATGNEFPKPCTQSRKVAHESDFDRAD